MNGLWSASDAVQVGKHRCALVYERVNQRHADMRTDPCQLAKPANNHLNDGVAVLELTTHSSRALTLESC